MPTGPRPRRLQSSGVNVRDLYRSGETRPRFVDDPPRPKKEMTATKTWQASEIEEARDRLFENGSEYMLTSREDVVGIDNVLVEIDQLIHWLRNSEEYRQYGSRLEPGVIFEGDPGTGKTLVSRYIASESNAFFINVRDFAHAEPIFSDSDIADLFNRARAKYAETGKPIVLFWDEFESGAIERSDASPDQASAVSQLTAELDGVHGKNEGLLLIGCTNYIYGIDAALKRSGRMGLQIEFNPPDRNGKKLLLTHYLEKYSTTDPIDVDTLSYFFDGNATAADIEESCIEAWRHAVYRKIEEGAAEPVLMEKDLIDVFLKRLVGPPTTFINLPKEDRLRIAVHETGHALTALIYDIPLRLITVQPGKKSLGRIVTDDVNEHVHTVEEIRSQMRVCIGSVIAERVADIPPLLGTSNDIRQINQFAVRLVDDLCHGDQSAVFSPSIVAGQRASRDEITPSVSESFVRASDIDVESIIKDIEQDVTESLTELGKDSLMTIAEAVNDRITLTGHEFEEVFREVTGKNPSYYRV